MNIVWINAYLRPALRSWIAPKLSPYLPCAEGFDLGEKFGRNLPTSYPTSGRTDSPDRRVYLVVVPVPNCAHSITVVCQRVRMWSRHYSFYVGRNETVTVINNKFVYSFYEHLSRSPACELSRYLPVPGSLQKSVIDCRWPYLPWLLKFIFFSSDLKSATSYWWSWVTVNISKPTISENMAFISWNAIVDILRELFKKAYVGCRFSGSSVWIRIKLEVCALCGDADPRRVCRELHSKGSSWSCKLNGSGSEAIFELHTAISATVWIWE